MRTPRRWPTWSEIARALPAVERIVKLVIRLIEMLMRSGGDG